MSTARVPASAPASSLSRARRVGVLAICCMSLLIVGLDGTIVNIALPSIGREFGARVSGLQWTVDAYTLVLASLLMLSGSVADRLGRRRTFQVGLTVFGLGSLLCSLAPNLGFLIAFRALQAVGGSMLNPVAMSIITNTFTDRRERAQAIGIWGAVVGISLGLGPVLGGFLVAVSGWRAIFWINVPIAAAAIVLSALFVPESKAPRARRLDPPAQVLLIVFLATLTFGIIEGPDRGWVSTWILGAFAVAAVSLLVFLVLEARRREPLLDLRFFRSTPFAGATVTAVVAFAGWGGFLFVNTLYLQQARGMTALEAGLCMLPMAVMTIIAAPISGAIVGSRGARWPMVAAGTGIMAATVMLMGITDQTGIAWLLVAYVIFGAGFGLVNAPITNAAVSGMPNARAGVAAAVASTSRQVGQAVGVAAIGALATLELHGSMRTGFAVSSHVAWVAVFGCGAVVVVLGVVTTSKRARRRARELAATWETP